MDDPASLTRDVASAGAKVAPPVMVTAAHVLGGLTLNDLLTMATIAYVLLQSGFLVWKWIRAARRPGAS